MVYIYILRFYLSSNCSLFHNSKVFGSCIIHIYIQGVLKLKKNNSGAKTLSRSEFRAGMTAYGIE